MQIVFPADVSSASPSVVSSCHIFGGFKGTFVVSLRKLRKYLELVLDKKSPKRYNYSLINEQGEFARFEQRTELGCIYCVCQSTETGNANETSIN